MGSPLVVTFASMLTVALVALTGTWLHLRESRNKRLVSVDAELLESAMRASGGSRPEQVVEQALRRFAGLH